VTITPKFVRLFGPADGEIKVAVDIVPEAKYSFRIVDVSARIGKNIRTNLTEMKRADGIRYRLTVENIKKDKGRYTDTIILKTTSNLRPAIKIYVFGHIYIKKRE